MLNIFSREVPGEIKPLTLAVAVPCSSFSRCNPGNKLVMLISNAKTASRALQGIKSYFAG